MNPIFESVQLLDATPKAVVCHQLHPQDTLQVVTCQICPCCQVKLTLGKTDTRSKQKAHMLITKIQDICLGMTAAIESLRVCHSNTKHEL